MANEDLVNYIKTQKASGTPDETIKSSLLANGWGEDAVREAFDAVSTLSVGAPATEKISSGIVVNSSPDVVGESQTLYQATTQTAASGAPTSSGGPSSLSALMPIGQTLREAWSLVKARWVTLIILQVLPFLALILILPVIVAFYINPILAYIFGFIVGVFIIILFLAISIAQIIALLSDQPLGVREALSLSRGKILSAVWLGLLSSFLIIGATFPFLIPGLILSFWFSQAYYALIAEDEKGFRALFKSREYVRGRFWDILVRFIVMLGISFGVSVAFSLAMLLTDAIDSVIQIQLFNTILTIANFAASFVLGIFTLAFNILVFKNLKAIRGSFDLVVTTGRKVKYFAISCVGFIFMVAFFVAMIAFFLSMFGNLLEPPPSDVINMNPL